MLNSSYALYYFRAIVVPFCQVKTIRLVLSPQNPVNLAFFHIFRQIGGQVRGEGKRRQSGKKYSTYANPATVFGRESAISRICFLCRISCEAINCSQLV